MVGSNGTFPTNMAVLDGKNFEQWYIKMGVIFGFQVVLEIVKNDIQKVEIGATELYRGTDKIKKVKLQSLCRQYEFLSINDQESIGEYFIRIQMLVNSVKACSDKNQRIFKGCGWRSCKKISLEVHEQRLLERFNTRRNDGGGNKNKNKKGKWKNKLKDSSEGRKVSNKNSSGNNHKKNGSHAKFTKKEVIKKEEGRGNLIKGI
ncbi:hypothetical protein CR513_27193, partial [Mucuna pruriens]